MKKSTMQSIINYLTAKNDPEMADVLKELNAEMNKGAEKAEANRQVYAEMREAVLEALDLAGQPVTAQELADETGYAKGKIVYGLSHYWMDEITKDTTGKSTTYSRKAS